MRQIILLIAILFMTTTAFGQEGEVNLTWDPVTTLCSGAPAENIEYHVHWSLSSQDPLISPPAGYESMSPALTDPLYALIGLQDCTTYYVAVSANIGTTWSGCDTTGGYGTEIAVVARPRLDSPNFTVLEEGKAYTLTITGFNFADGVFLDTAGLSWGVPTVTDCNNLTVDVTVPTGTALGPVDVRFARDSDDVVTVPNLAYLTVIDNTDAPPAPINVRRTQP